MMKAVNTGVWPKLLEDPSMCRARKPRANGRTMVIDKGLGLRAFEDLLETGSAHMDVLKLGFGTAALYPLPLLRKKLRIASLHGMTVMPGGTFLEVAVAKDQVDEYFQMIQQLGFGAVEVSDGTIEMDRKLRSELIKKGLERGLTVYTEYGKKSWGSRVDLDLMIETVIRDIELGAELVTVEGRESGAGVGIFDESGACRDEDIETMLQGIPSPDLLLWEAPNKDQQVHLIKMLGPDVNLGNIAPHDVFALEALRRGLRSDTFV